MILTDEINIHRRTRGLINASVRDVPGTERWRLLAAPRLEAAFGPLQGLAGGTAQELFQFQQGAGLISPSARGAVVGNDSRKGSTPLLWNPEDYATPPNVYPNNYIPGDDQVVFLRAQRWDPAGAAWGTAGPIVVVPPASFQVNPRNIFTFQAAAPNLGTGAYDTTPVDVLPGNSMVVTFAVRGQTFQITNHAAGGGAVLYVAFGPGLPPYVILGQQSLNLTGVTPSALYLGSPTGNHRFSVAIGSSTSL